MDVPAGAGCAACERDLIQNFLWLPRLWRAADAACEQAWPEMSTQHVFLRPGLQQRGKGLVFLIDGPVKLGREIVEPALGEPSLGVGIQAVVLTETRDAGRAMVGSTHTEGTDAQQHPGFELMHAAIQRFYQLVSLLSTPVAARQLTTTLKVFCPRRFVRKINLG